MAHSEQLLANEDELIACTHDVPFVFEDVDHWTRTQCPAVTCGHGCNGIMYACEQPLHSCTSFLKAKNSQQEAENVQH